MIHFKQLPLDHLKQYYIDQIEDFVNEHADLFPFHAETKYNLPDIEIANAKVRMITGNGLYLEGGTHCAFEQLTLEDLDLLIEKVFQPALTKYNVLEKGQHN